MKKIKITETELTKLIQKSVSKKLNEEEFSVEPQVPMTKREKELEGMFGSYSGEIPADVLRYMRKNPRLIMKRLFDIYGEKLMDYIPFPEDEIEMVDMVTEQDEEDEVEMEQEYPVDEFDFELDDSDVNDIMSKKGPMRRFRGSIYVDGVIPETDNKDYDRKLAVKVLENYAKKLPTAESYVGGVGFKQRSLLDPYDNMDF